MRKIFFLIFLLTIILTLCYSENNDDWGGWFKEQMKNLEEDRFVPEEADWLIDQWRNHYDKILQSYKYYSEKLAEGIDITKEKEMQVVPAFYFDDKTTEKEENRAVEFYIIVLENGRKWYDKLTALRNLVKIAYHGNERAKDYILKQKYISILQKSLRLRLLVASLLWEQDENTISYLLGVIKKAQDVETTDIKFSSPDESAILGGIRDSHIFKNLYKHGKDYNFLLPLLKQMLFSRSKGIQTMAIIYYYDMTNRAEMYRIAKECWAKIHDKNSSRKEFLDALYGLQALYFLQQRNFRKHHIGFKGIKVYFMNLAILEYRPEINKKKCILVATGKEKRLTDKEKIYFTSRLKR